MSKINGTISPRGLISGTITKNTNPQYYYTKEETDQLLLNFAHKINITIDENNILMIKLLNEKNTIISEESLNLSEYVVTNTLINSAFTEIQIDET